MVQGGVAVEKLRVAVLFGGRSGEHQVSLQSAASVLNAIDSTKYDSVPMGITQDGTWILPFEPAQALANGFDRSSGQAVILPAYPGAGGLLILEDGPMGSRGDTIPVDVIFPVLHGTYGEDGTVQGLFELADIAYVGAGVLGSAAAMDKGIMKDLFKRHGLPTPQYQVLVSDDWAGGMEPVLDQLESAFAYPVFVKPANLGSSVGVAKCASRPELESALLAAAEYDYRVVVEKAVPSPREIEVGVLGNYELKASVPGEIIPSREFYDYRAKYLDNTSQLLIPAPLSPEQQELVQELAIKAVKAVGAEGMARVDFLMSGVDGTIYLNEINTIPGFTSISMYPKLWEASGLSYPDLIDQLIQLGLQRWHRRRQLKTSYTPEED